MWRQEDAQTSNARWTALDPGYAYFSPDTDWHMAEATFENVPAVKVSMGPDGSRAFFFEPDGRTHAATQSGEAIVFDEFADFQGKLVPRRITYKLANFKALSAHIDLMEKTQPQEDEFLEIRGVKPRDSNQRAPR
jgi:hypothetical protein